MWRRAGSAGGINALPPEREGRSWRWQEVLNGLFAPALRQLRAGLCALLTTARRTVLTVKHDALLLLNTLQEGTLYSPNARPQVAVDNEAG